APLQSLQYNSPGINIHSCVACTPSDRL
ncbi:hypothetical protein ACN38_g12793, partial [Penicillium nordicum]